MTSSIRVFLVLLLLAPIAAMAQEVSCPKVGEGTSPYRLDRLPDGSISVSIWQPLRYGGLYAATIIGRNGVVISGRDYDGPPFPEKPDRKGYFQALYTNALHACGIRK